MQDYAKTTIPTQSIFTIFCGNVTHGPQKKPLYFGGNSDQVTLGLGLRIGGGDSGTSMNTPQEGCVLPGVWSIVTILRHQRPLAPSLIK